jgi:tRNA A-37 threonylcarbamoyl transferase component Bud32
MNPFFVSVKSNVKVIQDTKLDQRTIASMADLVQDYHFETGAIILLQGEFTPAALYFVRKGEVTITTHDGGTKETIKAGGFFGQEQLLADVKTGKNSPRDPASIIAEYTATVTNDCICGVLLLSKCRLVMDTIYIGKPRKSIMLDSITAGHIKLSDLKRHRILGAGTFGQVWLVSRDRADGSQTPYALKIQSKFELCENGQAHAVMTEKENMAQLHHPFLSNMVCTFQDENLLYMVMGIVQGGELHSVMYAGTRAGLPEKKAKFYAAGIAEGLAYMHRRGYVYRDLKPENVLVDGQGYCVIVDFGFVKFVADKSYTLCGTPLYIPPEIITNRGHNWGADHWSLGVLLYEMFEGYTPFYIEGMDQLELFKAIVRGRYHVPKRISREAKSMLTGFLTTDPNLRLGSLYGGEEDIYNHPWFKSIDFEKLRSKEIAAPYVPEIKDPLDASNFEDWSHVDDKLRKTYPKLNKSHQAIFEKF